MAVGVDEIHVGGTTLFVFTVKENGAAIDISGYNTRIIRFRKPNGIGVNQTGSLTTDGTDGKLQYQATTDDLDLPGQWQGQILLSSAGGAFFPSSWAPFRVYPNLPAP